MEYTTHKYFGRLVMAALIATLAIVLAGGVVRATGSGMGCPDWPRCFGRIIPPTRVSELPADYKEQYVAGRIKKNERFASLLKVMGKADLANYILHEKSIRQPEEFNAAKTYTEYVNRLVGLVAFYLCLGVLVWSFWYARKNALFVLYALGAFVFLGINAVLGAVVVSTNLTQWVITAHMLLTLVVLAFLVALYTLCRRRGTGKVPAIIIWLALTAIALSILQIVLGTGVREALDTFARNLDGQYSGTWLARAGRVFNLHRDFALAVLGANLLLAFKVRQLYKGLFLYRRAAAWLTGLLAAQIVTGMILSYFDLPRAMQPAHLLIAMVLFVCQFYLLCCALRRVAQHEQSIEETRI